MQAHADLLDLHNVYKSHHSAVLFRVAFALIQSLAVFVKIVTLTLLTKVGIAHVKGGLHIIASIG